MLKNIGRNLDKYLFIRNYKLLYNSMYFSLNYIEKYVVMKVIVLAFTVSYFCTFSRNYEEG